MKEKSHTIEITGVKNVCSSDTNLLRAQWMSPTIPTPQTDFSQAGKFRKQTYCLVTQGQPPITISGGFIRAKKIHTLIVVVK